MRNSYSSSNYFPGISLFNHWIASHQIHRVVFSYPIQVYDMFEIPTHQHIDLMNRCYRNMKRIFMKSLGYSAFSDVMFCKLF